MWLKAEQSSSVKRLPCRGLSWEQNRRQSPQMWAGGKGRSARSLEHMLTVGCKQRMGTQAHARDGVSISPCKVRRQRWCVHQPMQGQETVWSSLRLSRGEAFGLRTTFNLPPSRSFIDSMSLTAPLSSPDLHSGLEYLCWAPL